jgi:glycosyltransferase involved in cell wall biosynthesis
MNILILTNIYPADDLEQENTPIVHYFAREWVKMGVGVRVVHYPANFPKLMMWGASLFKKQLSSKLGATVRTSQTFVKEYVLEGVKVKRIPLLKRKLHGAFSKDELENAYQETLVWLEKDGFVPDRITSHWVNPQLEIMRRLKEQYHVKTCYVAHTATGELSRLYNQESITEIVSSIDLVGFRSEYIKTKFEKAYDYKGPTFQCYSGIPEQYIPEFAVNRSFENVKRFVFVGTLIKRKYPAEIITAVVDTFGKEDFEIIYIGQGAEDKAIKENAARLGVADKVHLLGRMSRDEVVTHLQRSDVFVMNSRSEAFGLVYLEAMAQGCLTIASRKEGFDGIIRDGENGFLCNAGDVEDLAATIRRVQTMSPEQRKRISDNAILTARELTDQKAASAYLNELIKIE